MVAEYEKWLSIVRTWKNAGALFVRVAESPRIDELLDHRAMLTFALIFRANHFSVSFEPMGRQGADLEVNREGMSALVEVTRYRRGKAGPAMLSATPQPEEYLEQYGDLDRDVNDYVNKISGKFRQISTADHAIIALWDDDEFPEELELERDALNQIRRLPQLPAGLQLILYGHPSFLQLRC